MHAREATDPRQVYLGFLRERGFDPDLGEDGDIRFAQGRAEFRILCGECDARHFRMVVPLHPVTDEDDVASTMLAARGIMAASEDVRVYLTADGWCVAAVERDVEDPRQSLKAFDDDVTSLLAARRVMDAYLHVTRGPVLA